MDLYTVRANTVSIIYTGTIQTKVTQKWVLLIKTFFFMS